jgi:DUF2959 family protein
MDRRWLLSLVCALAGACASSGRDRTESTREGMKRTRQGIDRVVKACDDGATTLADLAKSAQGDPRAPFANYVRIVGILETEITVARDRNAAMHEDTDAFFRAWEAELGAVKNPAIKAKADERRTELRDLYARVRTASQAAKEVSDPFLQDLRDLRVYLENDLTARGIAAATDPIAKITDESKSVKTRFQDLAAQIRTVEELLSATPTAAAR